MSSRPTSVTVCWRASIFVCVSCCSARGRLPPAAVSALSQTLNDSVRAKTGTMPPLHSQARKGNAGAVERLLSLDTEKSTTKLVYGSRTPLHQAAAANKGRLATCKLLLSFDEEQISAKTSDGSTPVHMLCQSDDDPVPVIQLFLKVGGLDLVREKKRDGSTILHLASTTGQLDLVTEILKVDAALASTVNGEVQTCLHIAAERVCGPVSLQHAQFCVNACFTHARERAPPHPPPPHPPSQPHTHTTGTLGNHPEIA